ncbi:MAG: hypothetical protein KGH55_02040 [Nanoarchaeota archaeon]|nr:hypothetical protein [Nanoarchaeota archaeon]
MKKEVLLIFLLAVMSISGIYASGYVAPINPGHNSSQIFVQIGNGYSTLQDVIDSGYLLGFNQSPVTTTAINPATPYELANQILVTYNNQNMSLQQAIDSNTFSTGTIPSSPITTIPAGGHYASEVNISINISTISQVMFMNLQQAINSNNISSICTGGCASGYHCDATQNKCLISCSPLMGQSCTPKRGASSQCFSGFTVQCDGSCSGGTYAAQGTACTNGGPSNDGQYTCDGSGFCTGWGALPPTLNGCGLNFALCPFGGSSSGNLYYCNLNGWQGRFTTYSCGSYYDTTNYGTGFNGIYWASDWSYNPSVSSGCYAGTPTVECGYNPQVCCWWQVICETPRCTDTSTVIPTTWQMKP